MKSAPALLAALAVAAPALAQAPQVTMTLVSAPARAGLPVALPDGESVRSTEWLAPGRLLINSNSRHTYLADGASLVQVCIPGTQIPGQAPGVVWGNTMGLSHAFPLRGRPPVFTLSASGPGLGTNVRRTFIGDPASSDPFWMSADNTVVDQCTPTALTCVYLTAGELRIGALDGTLVTAVPANFSPPGVASTISGWDNRYGFLNSDGVFAGFAYLRNNDAMTCIIDANGFRTLTATGQVIASDRGPFTGNRSIIPATQVLADGSAVMQGITPFEGQNRAVAFVLSPAGTATMIAVAGDPAPGAPAGFTLVAPHPLAATREGKVLWWSALRIDGSAAGAAIYLWSHGRSRQILRSGTPVAGAPDGAPVGTLDPSTQFAVSQLDNLGRIALIPEDVGHAAYLYTPEAGTVEFLRAARNEIFTIQDASVAIDMIVPANGSFSLISFKSGGDDVSPDLLSPDGTLSFCAVGGVNGVPGFFGLTARITSPGCRPDYNADGFLDFFDYDAFLGCFEGGACPNGKDADFNNDDFADFFDLIDYVDAFEAGC